jgi:hypothetical protein
LSAGAPAYHLQGRLDQFPIGGAVAAAGIDLRAPGLGRGLLDRLQISGRLDARRVPASGARLEWLAACYDYDAARPAAARLRLSCLEAFDDGEYFAAAPLATAWDKVSLELSSAQRSVNVQWPAAP